MTFPEEVRESSLSVTGGGSGWSSAVVSEVSDAVWTPCGARARPGAAYNRLRISHPRTARRHRALGSVGHRPPNRWCALHAPDFAGAASHAPALREHSQCDDCPSFVSAFSSPALFLCSPPIDPPRCGYIGSRTTRTVSITAFLL